MSLRDLQQLKKDIWYLGQCALALADTPLPDGDEVFDLDGSLPDNYETPEAREEIEAQIEAAEDVYDVAKDNLNFEIDNLIGVIRDMQESSDPLPNIGDVLEDYKRVPQLLLDIDEAWGFLVTRADFHSLQHGVKDNLNEVGVLLSNAIDAAKRVGQLLHPYQGRDYYWLFAGDTTMISIAFKGLMADFEDFADSDLPTFKALKFMLPRLKREYDKAMDLTDDAGYGASGGMTLTSREWRPVRDAWEKLGTSWERNYEALVREAQSSGDEEAEEALSRVKRVLDRLVAEVKHLTQKRPTS